MLILPTAPPVDYSLCNQTVTVYHNENGVYSQKVYNRAFLDFRKNETVSKTGSKEASGFLLVIPGEQIPVSAGDKVLLGTGKPVTTREEWAALTPAKVPGLVVVQYVDPKYWNGKVCHTEAGG